MSLKQSVTLDVGYPVYGAKYINNSTLVVTGGGGNGNHGIPNKITVIKVSFSVKDPQRRLQRFREITLPPDEDCPQCIDVAIDVDSDDQGHAVVLGCNQSAQLISSMNINNNLRKYSFTSDEHLRFVDAAQLEENAGDVGVYPKIVRISPRATVGALMTSAIPSNIILFNPDSLEVIGKITSGQEIRDFALSSDDDGKSLAYVTSKQLVICQTLSGQTLSTFDLGNLQLRKVRFTDAGHVVVGASAPKKGAVLAIVNTKSGKIEKQKVVSSKFNNITAIDVHPQANLIGIAGNDLSVTIVRLSDLAVLKSFPKHHPFAITSVAFNPRGTQLASVSAANKVHVFKIPPTYAQRTGSTIGTLFNYLVMILLIAGSAIVVQKAHETGQLQVIQSEAKRYAEIYGREYGALAKAYGSEALVQARNFGEKAVNRAHEEYDKRWGAAARASMESIKALTSESDIMSETSIAGTEEATWETSTVEPLETVQTEVVEKLATSIIPEPVASEEIKIEEPKVEEPVAVEPVSSEEVNVADPITAEPVAESVAAEVSSVAESVAEQAESVVEPVIEPVVSSSESIVSDIVDSASSVYENAQSVVSDGTEQVVSQVTDAASTVQSAAESVVENVSEVAGSVAENAQEVVGQGAEYVQENAQNIQEQEASVASVASSEATSVSSVISEGVESVVAGVGDVVHSASLVASSVVSEGEVYVEQATSIVAEKVEDVADGIGQMVGDAKSAAESVVDNIGGNAEAAASYVVEGAASVKSDIEAGAEYIVNDASSVVEEVKETVESVTSEVLETVEPVVAEGVENAEAVVGSAQTDAERVVENVQESVVSAVSEVTESAVSEATDISESVSSVASAVTNEVPPVEAVVEEVEQKLEQQNKPAAADPVKPSTQEAQPVPEATPEPSVEQKAAHPASGEQVESEPSETIFVEELIEELVETIQVEGQEPQVVTKRVTQAVTHTLAADKEINDEL
ncbi:hypothetical protein DIURU_004166 [Diutina rugosa]|uniref:Guanine nucleotide-exchange factor SEC12 n=1 Tax=Diutina rugosa TaxID=5481 RepID=A0A642UIJ4_DIURU|nr:uncharacterized protein DIURU_004166 [Diutina rugosa]KAA8899683.1 hypothetical protein DIURU_004166 [Diutina rugosa]